MLTVLAGCVPKPETPAPVPVPRTTQAPAPLPSAAPSPNLESWLDAPQSPGDWSYAVRPPITYATFGTAAQISFVMRCDRSTRTISLERASELTSVQILTLRTETATRQISAVPRVDSGLRVLSADLSASDPLLDAIALSRGRFAVEVAGATPLYIPSWAEVSRVIEDCR